MSVKITDEEYKEILNQYEFDRVVTTSTSIHHYWFGKNILTYDISSSQAKAKYDASKFVNNWRRKQKLERRR